MRTATARQRKDLYDWARKQKGKGSLKRIGKMMQDLSKSGGRGSKMAIRELGKIFDQKLAFIKGAKSCR